MTKIMGDEATVGLIEITDVDLRGFVRHCYDLSRPQGMGHIHYKPGPIPDEVLDGIMSTYSPEAGHGGNPGVALNMDYVLGRAVKMTVTAVRERWFIRPYWYDHTDGQLKELLTLSGIDTDRIEEARREIGR